MSRTVLFSPEALVDLDRAAAWLMQPGSGLAARRRLQAIWADIERLPSCKGGYRVLYEVDPDPGDNAAAGDVVILRIYGPG